VIGCAPLPPLSPRHRSGPAYDKLQYLFHVSHFSIGGSEPTYTANKFGLMYS
jgi:hypothetical protein